MGNVTLSKSVMRELERLKGDASYSAAITKLLRQSHKRRQDLAFNDEWAKCMNDLHQHIFTIEDKKIPETFLDAIDEETTFKLLLGMMRSFLLVAIIDYHELPTNF